MSALTKTRLRQLVAASIRLDHFQSSTTAREYWCPLNPDRRTASHRIRLEFWVGAPPKRADIERRFAEHFDPDGEECAYVLAAGGAREADEARRAHA